MPTKKTHHVMKNIQQYLFMGFQTGVFRMTMVICSRVFNKTIRNAAQFSNL